MDQFVRRKRIHRKAQDIAPDEIFADSSNVSQFDTDRFEGRMELPLTRRHIFGVGMILLVFAVCYLARAWDLQIKNGALYADRSEKNQVLRTVLFADRGIIVDRNGRQLAWNVPFTPRQASEDISTQVNVGNANIGDNDGVVLSERKYADYRGIANVVGYAKPPAQDSLGTFFREESVGVDGVEAAYNDQLSGVNGAILAETDAKGNVVSQGIQKQPQPGGTMTLSIDAKVSQGLYDAIAARADGSHFIGGAGVIMDVNSGEMIAMVSYPEFSLQTMADGTDTRTINSLLSDTRQMFLDRATAGLYTPGSIVKPIMSLGALTEGVVNENTQILSTGSISIKNPYDPAHPSVFKDWRAQGWVDVRNAIRVSSDVYFYEVGGGYGSQKGIGIDNIDKYLRMFGLGSTTGLVGFSEAAGTIPTPAWKEHAFPGDPWRIGDTYHTAIGQYGVQVTPLQMVRAVSAIANGGTLLRPTLFASSTPVGNTVPISQHYLQVVREGMRMCVDNAGTAAALNVGFVDVAGKTGTAQLGSHNQFMNSWVVGFFPYEHPRYAFAVVLERAPAGTLLGSPLAMFDFLSWMRDNAPEYLQ